MRASTLPPGLVHVERFQVAFDRDQRCPYCHAGLESDRAALAACTACRTLIHVTCAEHHGGCTTRGCLRGRGDSGRREAEAPRRAPLDPGRRWPLVLLVLLCGGATWALGQRVAGLIDPAPVVVPPPPVAVRRVQMSVVGWWEGTARRDGTMLARGRVELQGDGADTTLASVSVGGPHLGRLAQRVQWSRQPGGVWRGDFTQAVPIQPGANLFTVEADYPGLAPSVTLLRAEGVVAQPPVTPVVPVVLIGPDPAPALVSVVAPARTGEETLFLRLRVSAQLAWARIEVIGPRGERLTYDAARPGETMSVVTLPGPGAHSIEVRVTLPDGRTAVARHVVVRG